MSDTEAELRALLARVDPVPSSVEEAARAAFTWRSVDAELAELLRDSALDPAAVRGTGVDARQLSFESPRLGIELEVVVTGPRSRRLDGQLLPPASATVTIERPGEDGRSVQSDELGRFTLDGLPAGVMRLHIALRGAQITLPWTGI